MINVLTRNGRREDTDTERSRHVKAEAEIRIMRPQTKEHLEPPEAGRAKEGFSPRAFGKNTALTRPCFWTSGL